MASPLEPTHGGVRPPKVVLFCGGTGASRLIPALLDRQVELTCLVNGYDDGRSTGQIRAWFSILGPSDIRKNLATLSSDPAVGRVLQYRLSPSPPAFEDCNAAARRVLSAIPAFSAVTADVRDKMLGYFVRFLEAVKEREAQRRTRFPFDDCAVGNCLIVGALIEHGFSWPAAVATLECLTGCRGKVVLGSYENCSLSARSHSGWDYRREADLIKCDHGPIAEIFLTEHASPPSRNMVPRRTPPAAATEAMVALDQADAIIYAPGTLHSSLLPTFLISGIASRLEQLAIPKILITSIASEPDTHAFTIAEIIRAVKRYAGAGAVTHAICNGIQTQTLGRHPLGAIFAELHSSRIVIGDFEDKCHSGTHDPIKTCEAIEEIIGNQLAGIRRVHDGERVCGQ